MEIEIRAFINDIEEFKKKLDQLDASFESEVRIIDSWYCNNESKTFEEVQQHKPGSYALRIRQCLTGDKTITEMNCKVLENKGDHNAFHEYETKISDFEQGKTILEKIGFKIFCIVDKRRTTYKFNNCLINIEDIKGFKPAIELEIISDSNTENYKKHLKKILDQLGINNKDRIEKSITFLYMENFAFK